MKNAFNALLSLKEASNMWHLEESTLRKAITFNKFILNEEVKKFGKQWVITKQAMERVYGYLDVNLNVEDEYSEKKKLQIYYFITDCFNNYSKKYKESFSKTNDEFKTYGIFDYLYECYDSLHLSNTNEAIKDIRSRIRRGIVYNSGF